VANGIAEWISARRGTQPSMSGEGLDRRMPSLEPGETSRQIVWDSAPLSPKNKNPVKEPDELMKTSHLKSDTMPDPDELLIQNDLIAARQCFPIS
jgi:hypothetical protein